MPEVRQLALKVPVLLARDFGCIKCHIAFPIDTVTGTAYRVLRLAGRKIRHSALQRLGKGWKAIQPVIKSSLLFDHHGELCTTDGELW